MLIFIYIPSPLGDGSKHHWEPRKKADFFAPRFSRDFEEESSRKNEEDNSLEK